jgi:E3 Ubiquitin ligase
VISGTLVFQLPEDSIWPSALAVLGAAVGVYLFFRGFRMLQYKRLILNTPVSKIRSASMGLVEVSGTPTGPKTIAAAITGAPCYYYRARAWIWADSGKGGSWRQVVDESVHVPFFLDDSTGRVLVNPQGARLDVHRSFSDELRTSFLGKDGPVPDSIRKFVALRGLAGADKVRLEENIIQPGYPLFVFGTLGENTTWNWNAQPHVAGKQSSLGLNLGDSVNLNFTRTATIPDLAAKALAGFLESASGTSTRTSTYISRSDGGPVELSEDMLKTLQHAGVNLPFPVVAGSGKMTVSSRSSEAGVLRSHSMQVTIASGPSTTTEVAEKQDGTETKQSSGDFNLRAPVAISKGERGDPFTISSQSQREVVQSLGWKATACIWGGPVFALICLRCLFVFWGWM